MQICRILQVRQNISRNQKISLSDLQPAVYQGLIPERNQGAALLSGLRQNHAYLHARQPIHSFSVFRLSGV
jgi:hypothetical protein